MSDDLLRRLETVERAVSGGQTDLTAVSDAAAVTARLDRVEARVDAIERELATLDATLQAVRGYLGGVDGVSADIEQRADLALAKAEALEARLADDDSKLLVEQLPDDTCDTCEAATAHAAGHTDGHSPGADDDAGWATQAAERLSSPTDPTDSTALLQRHTPATDAAEGSATSETETGTAPHFETDLESGTRSGTDTNASGTDPSFVDRVRGVLDQ